VKSESALRFLGKKVPRWWGFSGIGSKGGRHNYTLSLSCMACFVWVRGAFCSLRIRFLRMDSSGSHCMERAGVSLRSLFNPFLELGGRQHSLHGRCTFLRVVGSLEEYALV
jgi:hypothetical protein